MPDARDKVTRFAAELVEAAAVEGARQSRSARQQLDHWVRLGRAVSNASSAQRLRVEAALSGELSLRELTSEEGVVLNAEITTAIEENLAAANYGGELAAEGITTVALDDDGNLITYRPDGSSTPLRSAG
jgi:hypothetical protein